MDIMTILEIIENSLTIIALLSGIIVAWLGLATWKKQIAGEAEHDLAKRTLKLVYQFRETIFHTRTWGIFQDININSQVITKSMEEFYEIFPEVEAFWGKATKESLYKIMSMGYRLLAALEKERRQKNKSKKEATKHPILIASPDHSDEFSQEIDSMIENLRVNLEPKLLLNKRGWRRNKAK